jgi:hypothetical protein
MKEGTARCDTVSQQLLLQQPQQQLSAAVHAGGINHRGAPIATEMPSVSQLCSCWRSVLRYCQHAIWAL